MLLISMGGGDASYIEDMPSPVGHTIFGLGIYVIWCKNLWNWFRQIPLIIWIIFCANLADFDLLLGLPSGDMSRYHQTYTHTIGFALAVGLMTFIVLKVRGAKDVYGIVLLTFIVVFSNAFLDLFNFDSRVPVGIMLFWPFSNRYFHISNFFYAVPHAQPGDVFSAFFMNAVVREIMLLAIPFLVLVFFKLKKGYGKG